MPRLPSAPVSVRATAALLATVVAAACVEGSPANPDAVRDVVVLLAPMIVGPADAAAVETPISRAQLTARDASTREVYGTAVVELDPTANDWSVPIALQVPPDRFVSVIVAIQLLGVVDGVATVLWSGETSSVTVRPGDQQDVRQVPLYRGPPDNLTVTEVDLTGAPASATEGDRFRVSARVVGGGSNPIVYFVSLDPLVAVVDAAGNVTAVGKGTARIVATSGPRADTGVVQVRAKGTRGRELEPAIDDAISRLLPHLSSDRATATSLSELLASIKAALAGELLPAAQQADQQARQKLAGYASGGPGAVADGPELSLIGLVLDHVERVLSSTQ